MLTDVLKKRNNTIETIKKERIPEIIVEKLEEPILLVAVHDTMIRDVPSFASSKQSLIKEGTIVKASEIHKQICRETNEIEVSFYKTDSGFVVEPMTKRAYECKNFARTTKETKIYYSDSYSNKLTKSLNKNEVVTIKYKLDSYTHVIYKGIQGYILNSDLEETNTLTPEEQCDILRDLVISNSLAK